MGIAAIALIIGFGILLAREYEEGVLLTLFCAAMNYIAIPLIILFLENIIPLDEIEHIEEYGVLLVNDSVEGTAFMIDALFHPSLKNVSGMNERELKIAREIQEEIIKYLSDEEGE